MAVYREVDGDITREYLLDEEEPIFRKKTERALVEVIPTKQYGLALFIDNELQFTEKDEYIYHEALIHPCMASCHNYNDILIIGGGDGCAVREILKWDSAPYRQLRRIDIIDWDEDVTTLFKEKYDSLNQQAFEDSRVFVENRDIMDYDVEDEDRTYDCIFIDLVDPNFEGSYEEIGVQKGLWDYVLFLAKEWIDKHGMIVINCGGILPWNVDNLNCMLELLYDRFDLHVHLYKTFVPSFGREWCFALLTEKENLSIPFLPHGLRHFSPQVWQYAYKDGWTENYLMNLKEKNQWNQENV